MNDNYNVPYLSPPIWQLLGMPAKYHPKKCESCEGCGRFISFCWSEKGDCVQCPTCDGTGILYIYVD